MSHSHILYTIGNAGKLFHNQRIRSASVSALPFCPYGAKGSWLNCQTFSVRNRKNIIVISLLSHSDQSSLGYQHSNRGFCLKLVLLVTVCQQDSGRSSDEFLAVHRNHFLPANSKCFADGLCVIWFPRSDIKRSVQFRQPDITHSLDISSVNRVTCIRGDRFKYD